MSSAQQDEKFEIHQATFENEIEFEDVEDYHGSYDIDHNFDHVDHRRQSVATIFTITKEELRRVPSLVNHEAHKVQSNPDLVGPNP